MWEKLKINVNQAFFSLEDKWFVGFLKKYLPCEIFVWNENNYVIQITINNRWAFWRIDHDIVRSKTIEGLNYLGGHNYLNRLNNRLNFDRSVRFCNVNRKPRSKDVKKREKGKKKKTRTIKGWKKALLCSVVIVQAFFIERYISRSLPSILWMSVKARANARCVV